jgi:4-amino-4-deoxy-L-arabinose transferase-like glycosyltransferase
MMRNAATWKPYVALVVLALALRLAFVAATPGFAPGLDAAHYDALACGLKLDGRYELRVPAGRTERSCGRSPQGPNPATAFRPPGWPVVLAGVATVDEAHRWRDARILQALIGTAAVALIGLAGWLLLGPAGGLIAMALAAADTTLLAVGGSMLSEPLFVLLVSAALVLALLARRGDPLRLLFAAGLLLGAATLVRSNGFVVAPVLALLAIPWSRRTLTGLAVMAAGVVLAVAPWTIRNAVEMDAFVPVASYVGTGLAGTFNEQARTRKDFPGAWVSPRHVFLDIHRSRMTELEKQRELRRRAVDYAKAHPGYAVEAGARNALRILSLADLDWTRGGAEALSLPHWVGPFSAAGFWLLLVLTAVALARRRGAPLLLLAPVLFIATAMFLGGELRYRAPAVPFLALIAAAGLAPRRAE